jgi:hypothetical protein
MVVQNFALTLHEIAAFRRLENCQYPPPCRNPTLQTRRSGMKSLVIIATAALLSSLAWAQNEPTTPATAPTEKPEATTPAKSLGVFPYPKNNQTDEQQLKDENECYSSAKEKTGIDPQAAPPSAPSAEQQKAEQQQAAQQAAKSVPKGGAVKGSAGGAAGGAAIGAIAGDAGEGAAIGATAGAVAGRRRQKKAQKAAGQQAAQQTAQAQQQAQTQASAQQQQKLDAFKSAFSACMDARDYSVK